ncbi:PLP-dependent transferase [Marasmius fiardii PR-910]|nr:PLP-dependent transferase [Marasmius fiardii PR-910]
MSSEKRGEAIDLSHHLSHSARARDASPLKSFMKYLGKPGIISLAGGLPDENYFPLSSISGDLLVPDTFPIEDQKATGSNAVSWFWKLFGKSSTAEKTTTFTVNRFPDKPDDLSLSTALQYGMAKGLPQLMDVIREFTEKVFQPGYINFATLVDDGNTDGISKSILTLCNPGEGLLVEEWTYPSTLYGIKPHGIHPVPVKMDNQGLRSDDLRKVLSEWDETARGMPRPHVLYTVPIGQNPTGVTVEYARKKEVYDACVEFDVIIIEDDPYYFLQEGPYASKAERMPDDVSTLPDDQYIAQLAPSYLKLDYQGRVVRLDSFSKTIAPGSRLGWVTCNPLFAERLERASETTTQAPCGFGQVVITSTLLQWKYEGYIRWLKGLRLQYKQRRDNLLDCFHEEFHIRKTLGVKGHHEGCTVYDASLKPKNSFMSEKTLSIEKRVFSFVPPTGGMFLWLEIDFQHHPLFGSIDPVALEMKLFTALAEAGLIIGPGDLFSATPGENTSRYGHFRLSFSNCTYDMMKKSVKILSTVLRDFMEDKSVIVA